MIENLQDLLIRFDNLNNSGRYQEVLAEVNSLLQQQEDSGLYVAKANAEYGIGNFLAASDALQRAISIDPDHAGARSNYGSVLFALGRYVDALNACDSALYIDDEFGPAYINAAHCLAYLGFVDLAADYLHKAVQKNPQGVDLAVTAALMMADMDLYDMARDMFMQVARMSTSPADIHDQIADFFTNARQKGVDRTKVISDINIWRNEFQRNPEVFRLASSLLN